MNVSLAPHPPRAPGFDGWKTEFVVRAAEPRAAVEAAVDHAVDVCVSAYSARGTSVLSCRVRVRVEADSGRRGKKVEWVFVRPRVGRRSRVVGFGEFILLSSVDKWARAQRAFLSLSLFHLGSDTGYILETQRQDIEHGPFETERPRDRSCRRAVDASSYRMDDPTDTYHENTREAPHQHHKRPPIPSTSVPATFTRRYCIHHNLRTACASSTSTIRAPQASRGRRRK